MMSLSCAPSESSTNASCMKEPSYMVPVDQTRTGFVVTEGIQKRFSFSVTDKSEDAISVYIRLKPKESTHKDNFLFYDEDKNTVTLKKKNVEQIYTFTHVFKPETTQMEVYEMCAKPSLEKLLYDRNAFIFTYGASNSGKTFTIQGDKNNLGLIPRALTTLLCSLKDFMDPQSPLVPEQGSAVVEMSDKEINEKESYKTKLLAMAKNLLPQINKTAGFIPFEDFERLGEEIENIEVPKDRGLYSVWLSFYEIYNEKVFDLFDGTKGPKKPLGLMTDKDSTIFVKGLRHIQVNTLYEAFLLYTFGRYNLSISSTGVNDRSSRSHSIFTIKIIGRPYHNSSSYFLSSSYSVCDLAGMERAHKTRNEGMRLKEAQQINSSFLVLNRCLRIIRENQYCEIKKHVPYRESKLTQILGPALTSSNTALIMIVAVSQNDSFLEETEGTLKSSSVATSIKAITPPPRRVPKKTRFSMAISKCMPGRAVDWKEIASTLQDADNRNKDTNANTGSCQNNCGLFKDMYPDGFKPDIYKELEEERNRRLAAEERISEIERNYRREMLKIEENSSRNQNVKELEKKLEEQEEEYMTCLAENLKLKKKIRLLKEEIDEKEKKIKELEFNCNTFEEILDDAKEEAEFKGEEVKELEEMIKTRDEMIILKDEKIESLEREIMNLEDNIITNSNEYEAQLMSLEDELQNKQMAYDELFSKYEVVTKELHDAQKIANDLENEKLIYFTKLQKTLEENDGYRRHIDTLENQMKHFEENKQDLIRRYETLLEDKENDLREKDNIKEKEEKMAYALRQRLRVPKICFETCSDGDTPHKMTPEHTRTQSEEKRGFLSDFDTNNDPSFIPHNEKSRTSVKKKRTKARKNQNRRIPDYGDESNAQSDATTSGHIDSSGRHRRKLFLRSSSDLAVCEDSSRMDDFNQTQASPATIVKRTLRTGKLY